MNLKKNREVPRLGVALEYLLSASPEMVQAFELARLNEAANLKANLVVTIERLVDVAAEAILARTLIEQRKKIHQSLNRTATATPADLLAELLVPDKRLENGKENK
jgi:hypothetical protein